MQGTDLGLVGMDLSSNTSQRSANVRHVEEPVLKIVEEERETTGLLRLGTPSKGIAGRGCEGAPAAVGRNPETR
jgi:hypothetical protein